MAEAAAPERSPVDAVNIGACLHLPATPRVDREFLPPLTPFPSLLPSRRQETTLGSYLHPRPLARRRSEEKKPCSLPYSY